MENPKSFKDNFEFLPKLVDMPKLTYKSHSEQLKKTYNKAQFEYPVSPLDVKYQIGWNDDLFSNCNYFKLYTKLI